MYFSQEQTILHNVRWAVSSGSIRATVKEPCAVSSAEIWQGGRQLDPGPTGKDGKEETAGQRGLEGSSGTSCTSQGDYLNSS